MCIRDRDGGVGGRDGGVTGVGGVGGRDGETDVVSAGVGGRTVTDVSGIVTLTTAVAAAGDCTHTHTCTRDLNIQQYVTLVTSSCKLRQLCQVADNTVITSGM